MNKVLPALVNRNKKIGMRVYRSVWGCNRGVNLQVLEQTALVVATVCQQANKKPTNGITCTRGKQALQEAIL